MSEHARQLLPDPCTGRDIAARLDVSCDYWQHNWRRLVADHAFPMPLPGFKRPLKWDPAQVEAWIRKPRAAAPAADVATLPPQLRVVA